MATGRHAGSHADSQGSGSTQASWLGLHRVPVFESLFAAVVVLNLLDLWTSVTALNIGLAEGNGVVVALGNLLGGQTVGGLALTKSLTIAGSAVAALLGIRAGNGGVRKTAAGVMALLVVLLLLTSLNNLQLIIDA